LTTPARERKGLKTISDFELAALYEGGARESSRLLAQAKGQKASITAL
jgi:hypothetical protein